MKNRKLGARINEPLSRDEMRNIGGGLYPPPSESCMGTFFLTTSYGCGYSVCSWAANGVDCLCEDHITTPAPCGYA